MCVVCVIGGTAEERRISYQYAIYDLLKLIN